MCRVISLMGRSCSGKDTMLNNALKMCNYNEEKLMYLPLYTTRPQRPNEPESAYNFVTDDEFKSLVDSGIIFEYRTYKSHLNGSDDDIVYYGTGKPENMNSKREYISIGTKDTIQAFKNAFDEKNMSFVYIYASNKIITDRACEREYVNRTQNYREMFRRLYEQYEQFRVFEKVIEKNTEISMHVPCFVSNINGTEIFFIRNELYDINKTTKLMLDIVHGQYQHLPRV